MIRAARCAPIGRKPSSLAAGMAAAPPRLRLSGQETCRRWRPNRLATTAELWQHKLALGCAVGGARISRRRGEVERIFNRPRTRGAGRDAG